MSIFAYALALAVTVVAAIVPPLNPPASGGDAQPPFPAPPGYLLPWPGGEIHDVTQGEETGFTHNGLAAYAFDFNLSYDTVVAARGGRVTMVREDSNTGGCSPIYAIAANYVLIDHGDGTSGLYLHLAQDSALVEAGQLVEQGQPIALSGETGLTCSQDGGPGAHLHFQVQRSDEQHYFTQSLPVAFDDIAEDEGVPQEGESYVSGNYGHGKPQKITLTPHRVPRVFNPVARPDEPGLIEAEPAATPAPPPAAEPVADAPATETPAPTPTETETPAPEDTETPLPTDTPAPTETPTPVPPPPTPTETSTSTPSPTPTETPTPAPPEPEPSAESPAPEATATPAP